MSWLEYGSIGSCPGWYMGPLVLALVGTWVHWLLSWLVYGSIGSCLGWYLDRLVRAPVGIWIVWCVSMLASSTNGPVVYGQPTANAQ